MQAPIEIKFQEWNEALLRMLTVAMGRHPRLSRANIADELSRLTGRRITEDALYAYTSRQGQHSQFPLALALPLCELLQDFELFAFILQEHAENVARLVREGKGRAPEQRRRK